MSDVIVEVRGGNVVGVYARPQGVRLTIVDWDHLVVGDTSTSVYTVYGLPMSELTEETKGIIVSTKP